MRRGLLPYALLGNLLVGTSVAGEKWYGLGHELGCWDLRLGRKAFRSLANTGDYPKLAHIGSYSSPDQFAAELRKVGMKPSTTTQELGEAGRMVMVSVDGKTLAALVTEAYCRAAPYRIDPKTLRDRHPSK